MGTAFSRDEEKLQVFPITVPAEAMETLQRYPWPGNVRELENVIERAVINTRGPGLRLMDTLAVPGVSGLGSSRLQTLAESEADCITRALEATHWQIEGQDGAATALGLPPSTLRKRMQKHVEEMVSRLDLKFIWLFQSLIKI